MLGDAGLGAESGCDSVGQAGGVLPPAPRRVLHGTTADGDTEPRPSGTFTPWLAQSCSRSRVLIGRNWEFSPKGWSGLPRHPRGSAGETPARRIPFGSRQQLIN